MSKLIKNPSFFSTDVKITDAKKLYLDGGTHTYIQESHDDVLDVYVGALNILKLDEENDKVEVLGANLEIDAAKKLYFDGGTETYIFEKSADLLQIVVGNDPIANFLEDGNSGNMVHFLTSGAGFTQHEPTYNATDTEVYFSKLGNKSFFTFGAGSVTDLNLYFPNGSCNCSLVIKQDGTGSRTVTNWKTFDQGEGNESTVKWAGGSAPTLSTGANAVDIISFYWDNDNHAAYGVASLNFS